jgi:hypothetical protein
VRNSGQHVWVMPWGGLANRLRVIAASVLFAQVRAQRLGILWSLDSACNCHLERLFERPTGVSVVNVRRPLGVLLKQLVGAGRRSPLVEMGHGLGWEVICERTLRSFGYVLDPAARYPMVLLAAVFSDFMSRGMSPEDYTAGATEVLRSLAPSARVRSRLHDLPDQTIGVHVRRRDLDGTAQPLRLFIEEMRHEVERDTRVRFFLATDELAVSKELVDIFGERLLQIEKRSLDRNSPVGIEDALVDLVTLSRTQRILGSYNSSFGAIASVLGGIDLRIAGHGVWAGLGADIATRIATSAMAFR